MFSISTRAFSLAHAADEVGHFVSLFVARHAAHRRVSEVTEVSKEIQLDAINVVGLAYFLDCPEALLAGWRLGEVNS